MKIREAIPSDCKTIIGLIKELATYEREPDAVINTAENLERDLFVDKICEAIVLEHTHGTIVGFALYYTSYSTWRGRCMYLEDIYIQPEYRQGNWGTKLFEQVVNTCKQKGYKRMDWQVLEWNEPAIRFYEKHGATLDGEWLNGRYYFD